MSRAGLLTATALGIFLPLAGPASAACLVVAGPGDDTYTCDSGPSGGGLADPNGNNTLLFPSGGTGEITGNVIFGIGNDVIDMQSGKISGSVDQGLAPTASVFRLGL